jgi:hypothetical protein
MDLVGRRNVFTCFLPPVFPVSTRSPNRKTVGLELLLKGKAAQATGDRRPRRGILAGGILAMIPHAIATFNIFRGALIDAGGLEDVLPRQKPRR